MCALGHMHGHCGYQTVAVGSKLGLHTLFQKSCPITCYRGGKVVCIASAKAQIAHKLTKV